MPPRGEPASIVLPKRLAEALSLGHPWVYRNHVPPGLSLQSGAWVRIRAGGFSAYALWDATSPIALRVFSRQGPPDRAWFCARIREAHALRAPLAASGTTAYRLLFGEGDGVPGVTVDLYDGYAVIVTYAESLNRVLPEIVDALTSELALRGVLRRQTRMAAGSSAPPGERLSVLWGSLPPPELRVEEQGVQLRADLTLGQKTGLFLDHRENRAFVRALSHARSVLNLFSYTGAFSVYAALGGASRVTSVDIGAGAIATARENFRLNQIDPEHHEFVAADVFEYLETTRKQGRKFECVISDPPSFAGSREKQHAALRAYVRLHTLALSNVTPGGLYVAASCTAQVSADAFRHTLAQGAARARVRLQLIHDNSQPLDHPVSAGHAEGRYLKFMVGRVLDWV